MLRASRGSRSTCDEIVFRALNRKCGSSCIRKAFSRASVNWRSRRAIRSSLDR